jgi:hypothetical protein
VAKTRARREQGDTASQTCLHDGRRRKKIGGEGEDGQIVIFFFFFFFFCTTEEAARNEKSQNKNFLSSISNNTEVLIARVSCNH